MKIFEAFKTSINIPIKIHWSVLFIIAVIVAPSSGIDDFVWRLFVALFLLLMVLMHEYAHCLAALRIGHLATGIELFALGGLAHIPTLREPKPTDEIIITLAGPASNIFAGIFFAVMHFVLFSFDIFEANNKYILSMWFINAIMGIFNLIPVFPMDGGRLLRAFLGMRYGYVISTKIATSVSFALSALMIIAAIKLADPFLFVISILVFIISKAERQSAVRGDLS